MELKPFVVTIAEYLEFCSNRKIGDKEETLFYKNIYQYSIPLYQREYKWKEIRIGELIHDVAIQDKFLGFIILERREEAYDIIDGQQRIMTIILLLASLFNKMGDENNDKINLEQDHILKYIMRDNKFVLNNDSLGEWLHLQGNKINLHVDKEKDVYCQEEILNNSWKYINKMIDEIKNCREFSNQLLDSKVLVLICEALGNVYSSEQIFLDMNDKFHPLETEEKFKGRCFSICYPEHHDLLKEKWIELKTNYFKLKDWGNKDFSDFIYHYILCLKGYEKIGGDLKVGGKHFLDNKTDDDIICFLNNMIKYSDNLCRFKDNLSRDLYRFIDICPDINKYNNVDMKAIKDMCKYILENRAQYYKFPFMMLISCLMNNDKLKNNLSYDIFRRLVTNYYSYSFAFINKTGKKDKSQINRTIFELLETDGVDAKLVLEEVKKLRKDNLKDYVISNKFNKDEFYPLYSIIDNFNLQDNYITLIYSNRVLYTDEHFIIPDNRKYIVEWVVSENDKNKISINLKDIFSEKAKLWKGSFANHMIIVKKLNGKLESFDIVTKLNIIENYYSIQEDSGIPQHIALFMENIKCRDTYKKLEELKSLDISLEENKKIIQEAYKAFVEDYFSDMATDNLKHQLQVILIQGTI